MKKARTPKTPHAAGVSSPARRRLLGLMGTGALAALGFVPEASASASVRKPLNNTAMPKIPTERVRSAQPPRLAAFDLADVRLLDGPFRAAQERDGAYLLFLEPDRLLHNFRVNAGLPPKAPLYGGWESLGVAGHTLGHYLSACALMYRSTGDARFRQRVDYITGELALCQSRHSSGMVTAIPDADTVFAKITADGTVTGWVPWYTIHKQLAGLRDAYLYCGNAQALAVMARLGDWTGTVTQSLTDAQFQAMLETEHGGMNETLADLYALTGGKKYLALARRFHHRSVLDPLAARQDALDGLHSNTQIPKVIGLSRLYTLSGDPHAAAASRFFWETVTRNRSYAIGGNGDYEHFFPVAQFADHLDSDDAAETCCTYNLLKLTRNLFMQTPEAAYADYAERALLNQILASQDPVRGTMAYFSPMKPGHFKVYGDPTEAFWCCTGTGIENHAKYADSIYFHDARSLYVNLFIASELHWREKSLKLRQETRFPEAETTTLTLTCARPTSLALRVRHPQWAKTLTLTLNGKRQSTASVPGSYAVLDRTWHDGDTLEIHLPMALHLEPLPKTPGRVAVLYGPVVLAGAMGRDGLDKLSVYVTQQDAYNALPALPVSALVGERAHLLAKIVPVPGQPLTFRTSGLGRPSDVTLSPYYTMHHQRYNLYWSVYSPDEWQQQKERLAAEERARRDLDSRTVDEFRPGEQQSEVDHHLQSADSHSGGFQDHHWRDASGDGWFSFVLKSEADTQLELLCTYWGSDSGRAFEIRVDDVVVAAQTLENNQPGKFFDVRYPLPANLTQGKETLTVKLSALEGKMAGGLFGCRLVRSESQAQPLSAQA